MSGRPILPLSLPPIGEKAQRRRPETQDQRNRRQARLAVTLADREHQVRHEIAALTGALPRNRHGSVTRLNKIEDPERRLEVLKARVERLEAVLAKLNRKRETRAKIVLGGALFAEARDLEDADLLDRFRDILDRRVERPRDRLAIAETFGIDLQPIREEAGLSLHPPLPDFEALIPPSARRVELRGAEIHPDYAGLTVGQDAGVKDSPASPHNPELGGHREE